MFEIAVGYVGVYLTRKSLGLLARAGSEVDAVVDEKLGALYEWVKAKLTGSQASEASLNILEKEPEGENQQAVVSGQLSQALGDDADSKAQLQQLVAELDRLRPPGMTLRALARAGDLYGRQVGANVEGPLPEGTKLDATAEATTVHKDGENIGLNLKNL
jgi:hypothetical protein